MLSRHSFRYRFNPPPSAINRGFTLVEILSVVVIISILSVGIAPLFHGMVGSQRVTKTVSDIAGVLEQARAHAMAKNTYVYVGVVELDQNTDAIVPLVDGGRIGITIMSSRSGVRPATMDASELSSLTSLQQFDNIKLEPVAQDHNMTRRTGSEVVNLADENATSFAAFTYQHAPEINIPVSKVLEFDPRGVVRVTDSNNIDGWIEIPLQPASGEINNIAAIQVDAVTGAVRIYRP